MTIGILWWRTRWRSNLNNIPALDMSLTGIYCLLWYLKICYIYIKCHYVGGTIYSRVYNLNNEAYEIFVCIAKLCLRTTDNYCNRTSNFHRIKKFKFKIFNCKKFGLREAYPRGGMKYIHGIFYRARTSMKHCANICT